MERNETSQMLIIWILISINVVDDFECSTDKRERFYDPMDPGLFVLYVLNCTRILVIAISWNLPASEESALP